MKTIITILFILHALVACTPEVGSEKWCASLDAKVKGDWTFNEAKDYAKHCLFDAK